MLGIGANTIRWYCIHYSLERGSVVEFLKTAVHPASRTSSGGSGRIGYTKNTCLRGSIWITCLLIDFLASDIVTTTGQG